MLSDKRLFKAKNTALSISGGKKNIFLFFIGHNLCMSIFAPKNMHMLLLHKFTIITYCCEISSEESLFKSGPHRQRD